MIEYNNYVEQVLNGIIPVSKSVEKECLKFKSWFDRPEFYFDYETVNKIIEFINSQVKLFAWEQFIIANIYGWYYKGTAERVNKNLVISAGRKNGRTTFAILTALIESIFFDNEVTITAISYFHKQEWLNMVKKMVKANADKFNYDVEGRIKFNIKSEQNSIKSDESTVILLYVMSPLDKIENEECWRKIFPSLYDFPDLKYWVQKNKEYITNQQSHDILINSKDLCMWC